MVRKVTHKISPKKGDSDSDFVDSPPISLNFSHASSSRYPIRRKIRIVKKKVRTISHKVARRRKIVESEEEEEDEGGSSEEKISVCNRDDSHKKVIKKRKKVISSKFLGKKKIVNIEDEGEDEGIFHDEKVVVDNRVLQEWNYYVPKGLSFTKARFSSHVNIRIVQLLEEKLSSVQLDMFRNTVFGHFLDMRPFFVQNQVLCYLVKKEMVQENRDKFYVNRYGSLLCFGIEEFAAVTGLKCEGDIVEKDFYEESNRLKRTYFPHIYNVDKNELANCFLGQRWNSDEDAVKIVVLYFIYTFLFSAVARRDFITDQHFYLVDSEEYMSFPWGKAVFLSLMASIRDKMFFVGKFHRFGGLPLALQIWLYECCSDVDSEIAIRVGNESTRILNWEVIHDRPTSDLLLKTLFRRSGSKVFRNFLHSSEVMKVKSNNSVSKDITKGENQRDIIRQKKEDNNQKFKLNKEDGEDSILWTRIEKLEDELSSLKKFVEVSFSSMTKDKPCSSCLINLQHHQQGSNNDVERDLESPKEYVLRSEFDKLSNEYSLFKKLVEKKLHDISIIDNTTHESHKEKVNDDIYYCDDIGVSHFKAKQNTKDVIHFDNTISMDTNRCQVEVEGMFEDNDMVSFEAGDFSIPTDSQVMVLYDEAINQCKKFKEMNLPQPINFEAPVMIVDDTPMPSKRVKTVGKFQRSPFLTEFDSVENIKDEYGKRKVFVVKHPFNELIDEDVDYALRGEFAKFVDKWALKGRSRSCPGTVYQKGKDVLLKPFIYGDLHIKTKNWFYSLNYGGRTLQDTHIDVIFYYLRKLHKYDVNIEVKFTTTNFPFSGKIKSVYKQFKKCNMNFGVVNEREELSSYVIGSFMPCACPWYLVDHVLIPIFVEELLHWVLGVFTIKDRAIHVYDSMRGALHERKVLGACEPYAVLIPHLLYVTEFYIKKQGVSFNLPPYSNSDFLQPLDVKFVDGLRTQNNSDCGIFIAAFAEYFVRNRQFPYNFDVLQYRSRMACLLWNYGLNKQKQDAESESEFPTRKVKNKCEAKRQKI